MHRTFDEKITDVHNQHEDKQKNNNKPNALLVDLMNEGMVQLSVPEKEKEKDKKKKKKKKK